MVPFRTHAYEVRPQRKKDTNPSYIPRGGAFTVDKSFAQDLEDYLKQSKLATQPTVDFCFADSAEEDLRLRNKVRSDILDYCFGAPATAKKAALALANRLADAMDDRSPYTLLMLVAYSDDSRPSLRRLVVWAFPKDKPFQFKAAKGRASIKLPKDIFSRSSNYKKGALCEGENSDQGFLSGHVIDKQAQDRFGSAADYWIRGFLDAKPSLSGTAGTRLLARVLKETFDDLDEQKQKDEVTASIVAIHASQRRQWSLNDVAEEYLSDAVKPIFFNRVPPETRFARFAFQREEFINKLNFRVFRLKDDVMVSAPFGTIGHSVHIRGKKQRTLLVKNEIVEEKVKAQHYG